MSAEEVIRVLQQLAATGPANDETIRAVRRIEGKLASRTDERRLSSELLGSSHQVDPSSHAQPGQEAR
jgi:hypothetical protein